MSIRNSEGTRPVENHRMFVLVKHSCGAPYYMMKCRRRMLERAYLALPADLTQRTSNEVVYTTCCSAFVPVEACFFAWRVLFILFRK